MTWMNDGFDCCGLGELSNFPERKMSRAELTNLKEELLSNYGFNSRDEVGYSHVVVTLKQNQRQVVPVLRSLGFKLVGDAVNPNTNNRLWMYVYMRPEKKPAKRKPKLDFSK